MLRCETIIDRVARTADGGREPACIFERALGRADQIAAAMEMQHDIAPSRIRCCDTKGFDITEFVLDCLDFVGQREIRGQETLIGFT